MALILVTLERSFACNTVIIPCMQIHILTSEMLLCHLIMEHEDAARKRHIWELHALFFGDAALDVTSAQTLRLPGQPLIESELW